MKAILAVFRKEVLDNVRDRRTLMSSLLFAPLFGPILFAVAFSISLLTQISDLDEPLDLPMIGAELAPNLVTFLERQNVIIQEVNGDPETLVKDSELEMVLIVPEEYPERFLAGDPAPLSLIADESNVRDRKSVTRAEALLRGYNRQLGALRLQVRGVSPQLMTPVAVQKIDVSTREGRAILVLGMITYFVLFAALMGGMYLAIDATAGERDRNSLESLLALPVARRTLMLGKIAATALFMLASVAICVTSFYFGVKIIPLEQLDMTANFTVAVAVQIFLVLIPYVIFGAGLMMIVATFTRTHKEAQTYLSVLLAVPTMPILFAGVMGLKPSTALMAIPSLGQHLLITDILKDEPITWLWVLVSVAATTALGVLLCWIATARYNSERILL
ncbi:MAG: ABC transporter permease [Gammaproteobacteria bacterium]